MSMEITALSNGQVKIRDSVSGQVRYFQNGNTNVQVTYQGNNVIINDTDIEQKAMTIDVTTVTVPAGAWTPETLADTLNSSPYFFKYPSASSILPGGTVTNSTIRWNGSAWVEATNSTNDGLTSSFNLLSTNILLQKVTSGNLIIRNTGTGVLQLNASGSGALNLLNNGNGLTSISTTGTSGTSISNSGSGAFSISNTTAASATGSLTISHSNTGGANFAINNGGTGSFLITNSSTSGSTWSDTGTANLTIQNSGGTSDLTISNTANILRIINSGIGGTLISDTGAFDLNIYNSTGGDAIFQNAGTGALLVSNVGDDGLTISNITSGSGIVISDDSPSGLSLVSNTGTFSITSNTAGIILNAILGSTIIQNNDPVGDIQLLSSNFVTTLSVNGTSISNNTTGNIDITNNGTGGLNISNGGDTGTVITDTSVAGGLSLVNNSGGALLLSSPNTPINITTNSSCDITTAGGMLLVNSGANKIIINQTFDDNLEIKHTGTGNIYITNTGTGGLIIDSSFASVLQNTTDSLAFYGVAGTTQPTALTATVTTLTGNGTLTDFSIQATQLLGFGFASQAEGDTFVNTVINMQARINELETKLQALGLIA